MSNLTLLLSIFAGWLLLSVVTAIPLAYFIRWAIRRFN